MDQFPSNIGTIINIWDWKDHLPSAGKQEAASCAKVFPPPDALLIEYTTVQMFCQPPTLKLVGLDQLVADPPCASSTPCNIHPLANPQLDIAVTVTTS